MEYAAKTERGLLGLLLAITLSTVAGEFSAFVTCMALLPITIIIIALFVTYKLTINQDCLIYEIQLLHKSLYKTVVYPEQIISVRVQRFGWNDKGAVITLKKRFRIKLVQFVPDKIWDDLQSFADDNKVPSSATKDYMYMQREKQESNITH